MTIERFQNIEYDKVHILVGVAAIMGTGMNLTRAYRTIILDPDWTLRTELQIRGRTNRSVIVQLAPKTTTYRVLARDDYLESRIVDCQNKRNGMIKKTMMREMREEV